MKIVLEADPDSAPHRNRNRHGGKLRGADTAERPQRALGKILEHGRHVTQITLSPGDVTQDDVQVAGGRNDFLAEQVVGIIDHSQVKRFQFG